MDIQQSLDRILQARDTVGAKFYTRFLADVPEARPFFAMVDMKRQGVLLTTALMVVVRQYTHPTPAVDLYLRYLGTRHNEMRVNRSLYPKWVSTLMLTLAEFHGDDWSDALEQQWREAIEQTQALMFAGYEQRITV